MSDLIQPLDDRYQDYLRDESRKTGAAERISLPSADEEVAAALRTAAAEGLPVTVQGARTGIVAGAVPDGGLVLCLENMRRATGLQSGGGRLLLSVQPGMTLETLRAGLAARELDGLTEQCAAADAWQAWREGPRLLFPPDPTEPTASLGGMTAANASGAQSFQYGAMRRHVHGLSVRLADGEKLTLKRGRDRARGLEFRLQTESGKVISGVLPQLPQPKVKNAAGYYVRPDMDLVDLFIGGEGTLGIITELELILRSAPAVIWGIMAFMPNQEGALKLTRALRKEPVEGIAGDMPLSPAALEFFNRDALRLLRERGEQAGLEGMPQLPAGCDCALYIEFHADDEQAVEASAMQLAEWVEQLGGSEENLWLADSEQEMERMKGFRHAVPEAVNQLIDERRRRDPQLTKLGTDMSVPSEHLESIIARYESDLAESGLESAIFGHIGDNHLHVNILPRSMEDYNRGWDLYRAWAREVVGIGGSISAEHGVGKLKRTLLRIMVGEKGEAAMRDVKRIFDPAGRLNRGNLLALE